MKHAYVSVVIPASSAPSQAELDELDTRLSRQARLHETVVALSADEPASDYAGAAATGPITVVLTYAAAREDAKAVAGLARAVGDFVIEWRGPVGRLDDALLERLLDQTDIGVELVEVTGRETSVISKLFYRFANSLRPQNEPIRRTVGRLYSRQALGQVIASSKAETQISTTVAELPSHRAVISTDIEASYHPSAIRRLNEGMTLIAKGTRFGTVIPLTFAAMSALFSLGIALFALGRYAFAGETPEGWTTLMVLSGLGQAAILAMLGLTWTRVDALSKAVHRRVDATARVSVFAPTEGDRHNGAA